MPFTLYDADRSTATVPVLTPATVMGVLIVCESLPDVPVIVIVEVPRLDASPAVSVSLPVLALPAGPNEAVTPGGSPETLKLTPDLKLPRGTAATVIVPLLPLGTEKPAAGVRSVKSSTPTAGGASRS